MYEVFEFIVIAGLMVILASSLLNAVKVICEEPQPQPEKKSCGRSDYQRRIDFEYSREMNKRILKDDAA